jgi:hypothetical protein
VQYNDLGKQHMSASAFAKSQSQTKYAVTQFVAKSMLAFKQTVAAFKETSLGEGYTGSGVTERFEKAVTMLPPMAAAAFTNHNMTEGIGLVSDCTGELIDR